ncbi:hypothetical protein B566_EDAN010252 [Ephemera danica]|nr:hypothetical protein B566_EDAN010252 [Ephemera danica]
MVLVLSACLAVANAGFLAAPVAVSAPAVASVSQNTYRGFGNVGQVSTYSKSLDTPFSSVRKSDVRITNGGGFAAPVAYAAPYSPYVAKVATPVAYASPYAPAVAKVATPVGLGVAYSPAATVAHYSFDGFGTHYAF